MKFLIALLVTGVVLSGIGTTASAAETSLLSDISLPDLKKAIAEGKVTLIDCNGDVSFARGHIPGAIDFHANKSRLAELLPADKTALVVSYCSNPRCDKFKDGVEAAERLGYTRVKHFSPGIRGWTSAGEPVAASGNK
jgi:rhodanese-related sulfurtransferase